MSVILGRTFLATGHYLLDFEKCEIILRAETNNKTLPWTLHSSNHPTKRNARGLTMK